MTWPDGYDRQVLATVDSTMAEAARRAAAGLAGPTWILAGIQTAARGRHGRAWLGPDGNFAATLVLQPVGALADAALRSFVAALALDEALSTLTGQPDRFALKWPNDVLLDGGKVAGILLESHVVQGQVHLAVGIGVNLLHAPAPEAVEPRAVTPVALAERTGITVTPETLLDALAEAYAGQETRFRDYGFAPIRAAWLARAARLGEAITARTGRESQTGIFADVDNQGQLVLDVATGRVRIPAGDVFF